MVGEARRGQARVRVTGGGRVRVTGGGGVRVRGAPGGPKGPETYTEATTRLPREQLRVSVGWGWG